LHYPFISLFSLRYLFHFSLPPHCWFYRRITRPLRYVGPFIL
jgi:hypothetical protein